MGYGNNKNIIAVSINLSGLHSYIKRFIQINQSFGIIKSIALNEFTPMVGPYFLELMFSPPSMCTHHKKEFRNVDIDKK